MPSDMSFERAAKRFERRRMAVRDWATVSAMPPRTWRVVSYLWALWGWLVRCKRTALVIMMVRTVDQYQLLSCG